MVRCKRLCHIATLSLYAVAACASAQIAPPVLEVDFTTATVPLSPALSVVIAIAIAVAALFALRRTRGGARLMSWAIVLGSLPLAYALMHTPIISQAQAMPTPSIVLPLTSNPVIVTGPAYFDYVQAINVTGSRITIVAVKYNPGGYDYYLDTATTTCVPGLALAPGAFCFIRILSLG
jgi:hypothetical protein